jgi:competence protein ComEC
MLSRLSTLSKHAALGAAAGGVAFAGALVSADLPQEKEASALIAFLDVGQGDAIFVQSPEGNQMLIDAGANAAVLSQLPKVMGAFDRTLDIVVATHPDADHIGGLPEVFARYRVAGVVATEASSDNGAYNTFIDAVVAEGARRINVRAGTVIRLGERTTFTVLYPDGPVDSLDTNDASIVGILRDGEVSVMLTGEAPQWVERRLVERYGARLDADILKVGHHGSKTSTAPEFVKGVSPEVAVISAGKDNRYGHPHQETLATLAHFGVHAVSTAEEGTIVYLSDGERVRRER